MVERVGEGCVGEGLTSPLCFLDNFWSVDDRLASPKTFEVCILVQENCSTQDLVVLESWHAEQYDSGRGRITVSIWELTDTDL